MWWLDPIGWERLLKLQMSQRMVEVMELAEAAQEAAERANEAFSEQVAIHTIRMAKAGPPLEGTPGVRGEA